MCANGIFTGVLEGSFNGNWLWATILKLLSHYTVLLDPTAL